MAQTPKSLSVNVTSLTGETIYTVPAGTKAVVKTLMPVSISTNNYLTINKVSGGTVYPLSNYNRIPYTPATGANTLNSPNALSGPITLDAGESLTASIASTFLNAKATLSSSLNQYPAQLRAGTPFFSSSLYANGIFMVVGYQNGSSGFTPQYQGFALTSTDGVSWTYSTGFPEGTSVLQGLAYGGGVWVATGNTDVSNMNLPGYIWRSADNGATWTKVALPSSTWTSYMVWYLNGYFIVSDRQNYLYISTDGSTWTQKTGFYNINVGSPGDGGVGPLTAAYINSTYIFGTQYGTIYSTDLNTFTSPYTVNSMAYPTGTIIAVDYCSANTTYYAISYWANNSATYPNMFKSTDGINWTWVSTLPTTVLSSGGGLSSLAAVKNGTNARIYVNGNNDASPAVTYSTDGGTTWTQGTIGNSYKGPMRALANGGVVVREAGYGGSAQYYGIWNSTNLITNAPTATLNTGVGSSGDYTVASSTGNWVGWFTRADNGLAYQFGGSGSGNIAQGYNNVSLNGFAQTSAYLGATGRFYLISTLGTVYYTTAYNSSVTTLATISAFENLTNNLVAIGNYLVNFNDNGAYYSTDGTTWTKATKPTWGIPYPGGPGQGAVSSGSLALTVTGLSQVWATTNGTTFTSMPAPDCLAYADTVNGVNFLNYKNSIAISNSGLGSNSFVYTATNVTDYSTYTRLNFIWAAAGSSSVNKTYNQYPAVANHQINYDGTNYVFTSSNWNGVIATGIIYSSNLVDFTTLGITGYLNNLNGVPYIAGSSSNWSVTTNGSATLFTGTGSPNVYTTTPSSYKLPITVSAGIIEIS